MLVKKPIIFLVPGAWHQPHHYFKLIDGLATEGYTVLAPGNASAGRNESPAGKSYADDVRVIHDAISPYLDQGMEVVVVCHSYGGVPASHCAEGQTVIERREKGLKGGIRALVYIAAYLIPPGPTVMEFLGGVYPDFTERTDKVVRYNDRMFAVMYSDVPEADVRKAAQHCVNQSTASLETPITYHASSIKVPKIYVACENDQGIPISSQLMMAEAGGAEVVKLPTGHSPFAFDVETKKIVEVVKRAGMM